VNLRDPNSWRTAVAIGRIPSWSGRFDALGAASRRAFAEMLLARVYE
jgi:hypothetical protein